MAIAGTTSHIVEMFMPGVSVGEGFYNGPNTAASMLIFANGQVRFRLKACNAAGCSGWSGFRSIVLKSDL